MFSILKNINHFAGRWKSLDNVSVFCARYLIYLTIFFLLIISIVYGNLRLFVYCFTSGLFATFIIAKLIYFFYKEHRPADLRSTKVLIPVPKNPSFPSSHASFLFGFSFLLLFYNFNLGIIFLICSLIVGIARVFCGVHWFHDIIGGIAAGLFSSLIIYYLLSAIKL